MQDNLVVALRGIIYSIIILIGVLFVIFSISTWITSGFGGATLILSIHFLGGIYMWYWGLEKLTNKEKMLKPLDLVELVRRKRAELVIIPVLIGIGFLLINRSDIPPLLIEIYFFPLMILRGPFIYPVEVFVDLKLGIPGISTLLYTVSLFIQLIYFYYIARVILAITTRIVRKG